VRAVQKTHGFLAMVISHPVAVALIKRHCPSHSTIIRNRTNDFLWEGGQHPQILVAAHAHLLFLLSEQER